MPFDPLASGQAVEAEPEFNPLATGEAVAVAEPETETFPTFNPLATGQAVELSTEPPRDNGTGRISTYSSKLAEGGVKALTAIPKWITTLTHKLDIFGAEEGTTLEENPLYQVLTGAENLPAKIIPQNPKYEDELGAQVIEGVGQIGGTVATGGLSGIAKTAPKLFALLQGVAQEFTSSYEEARAHGASEDDAFKTAVATGALAGPLDAVVPAHMMERLIKGGGGKITKAIVNLALEGGSEAITEMGQTVIENAVAKKIYDQDRGYWDGVIRSGEAGGLTGAIASAIISAATGVRHRPSRTAEKIEERVEKTEVPVATTQKPEVTEPASTEKAPAAAESVSREPIEGDFTAEQDEEIKALNPEPEVSVPETPQEISQESATAPEPIRTEAPVPLEEQISEQQKKEIEQELQSKPAPAAEAQSTQVSSPVVKQRKLKASPAKEAKVIQTEPIDEKQLASMPDEEVIEKVSERFLHKFTPAVSNSVKAEAKLMKSEIEGGEAGRRIPVFDPEDPYTTNPSFKRGDRGYEFTGIPSSYPDWYGKLKRPKKDVLKALQKIIEDQGKDKGKFVERLKRIIVEKKLHGYVDKEAGPIPPDEEFLQAIGRKIDVALEGVSEEQPSYRVDDKTIREYTISREIQAPEAQEEVRQIVQNVAQQNDAPYQQELNLQGTEVSTAAPRRARERPVSGANAEAIASPEKIAASDFGKSNRVTAWVEKLLTRQVPSFDIRGKTIETPQDFAALLQPLRSPLFESLKIAFLDDNGTVVHSQILTVGTINQALFSNRDAIATLVEAKRRAKTSRVIIAHNHPSGHPQPSPDDIRTTRAFEEAIKHVGLTMVDHIITNGKTFYSFKSHSVMDLQNPVKAPWEKVSSADLKIVNQPEIYRAIVENLRQADPGYVHILYVNSKLGLVAVDRFTEKQIALEKTFHQKVIEGGSSLGASGVFIDFGTGMDRSAVNTRLRKLGEALRDAELPIYDAADAVSLSRKSSGTLPSFGASEQTSEYKLSEEVPEYGQPRSGRNIGSDNDTVADSITDAVTTGESIPDATKRMLNFGKLAYESAVDVLRKSGGENLSKLAARIERYYDDKENLIGARTSKFTAILDRLSRKERKVAFDEFEKYILAREDTQNSNRERTAEDVYQQMSHGGKRLVDEVKNLFVYTGEINTKLGVKNRNPITGEIRPTANLNEKYWPRVLKKEVRDILSNPKKNPAKYNEYLRTIQTKNGFVSLAQAEQFLSRSGVLESSNDFLGHLEVARVGNLPIEFYENRFENVIPKFITRWSDRISQIKNFGQKIGGERKDIFDKTMESTTDAYTKEYIGHLRDRIYQKTAKSDVTRLMNWLRTYTTMTKLSSVWSSIRNLSSVFTNTMPEFGVRSSVPEAVKVLLHFGDEVKRAQEAGALKADLVAGFAEMSDLSDIQRKAADTALKYSGFNLVETFNRTHAAATARAWARWALQKIETNPNSRSSLIAQAKFKKYGIDYQKLKEEGLEGREARKLMRAGAKSTQFNYDLRQVPLWAEAPAAKFLFQFQKFGLQQLRRLSEDVIDPMIKGHTINGQKVRDFRPFIYMMAAAFGTGELLMMLRDLLFGKGRNDASLNEISKTLDENEERGLTLLAQRLAHDLTYAGGLGSLGDWSSNIEAFITRGRAKSPIDPPGLGPLKNAWDNLILTAWQQGTLTSKDVIVWAKNEVPVINYAESAAKQVSGDELYEAQKSVRKIKQLGYRYSVELGLPTQSSQTFDKNANTPLFRDLQEALLVADHTKAKALVDEFLKPAKTPEQRKKRMLALQASVRMRQPFKAGAIDTEDERLDFKGWLINRVGVEELADLNTVETNYVKTAKKLGLMKGDSISLEEVMRQSRKNKVTQSLRR
jgi:DNA repair protein RadC